MSSPTTCCTCATLLISAVSTKPHLEKSTRPTTPTSYQLLPCCGRAICDDCISRTVPTSLPQGLRDPPAYESAPGSLRQEESSTILHRNSDGLFEDDEPPEYSAQVEKEENQGQQSTPDVTHHLHPIDTVQSLSLAYAVPLSVLRNHNNLFNDSLLPARRTMSIPGSHYKGGVSLSPKPIESEDERERKAKVRRFMVQTKCHQYDMAEVYLSNSKGDVETAVQRWRDDEKWEKENPMRAKDKGKVGRRKDGSGGLTGQMS